MAIRIYDDDLKELIRSVVIEVLGQINWPPGRVALTEIEAASAMGVPRHVLRDLRLQGKANARKLGRRYVYSQVDLLHLLQGGGR